MTGTFSSTGRSATFVQTEISQQVLDGLELALIGLLIISWPQLYFAFGATCKIAIALM